MTQFEIMQTHKFHHQAWAGGYVPINDSPRIMPYNGRFGKGYTIDFHSYRRYCVREYWIREERR